MTVALSIAEVASLVGDPGRANMLSALLDGRALTATELAYRAGVAPATASGHLAKLAAGRLVSVVAQGRHRYFRLASPDVARMLEGIMVVAAEFAPERRVTPRIDPALREARTCYDHLAGRLGGALADALVGEGSIVLSDEAGEVTEAGRDSLARFGLPDDRIGRTRRLFCRPCLDVALQAQLLVLTPQSQEFIALNGRERLALLLPAALAPAGLSDPVADRLSRGLELTSQIGQISSGAGQLDHLSTELR